MTSLGSKANNKLRALARVIWYMSIEKWKLLVNSFFSTQCNYCLLIRMLHGASKNYVISYLYGRCMRLIYHDKTSSYKELLPKDDLVYIHPKNSHINLAIEL